MRFTEGTSTAERARILMKQYTDQQDIKKLLALKESFKNRHRGLPNMDLATLDALRGHVRVPEDTRTERYGQVLYEGPDGTIKVSSYTSVRAPDHKTGIGSIYYLNSSPIFNQLCDIESTRVLRVAPDLSRAVVIINETYHMVIDICSGEASANNVPNKQKLDVAWGDVLGGGI